MSRLIIPSYQSGYARNAAEAMYPGLWKGLVEAYDARLGVTGNTLRDIAGSNHGTLSASMTPSDDWFTAEVGPSLRGFTASASRIDLAAPVSLTDSGDWTCVSWCRLAQATNADLWTMRGKSLNTSSFMTLRSSNQLRVFFSDFSSIIASSGISITEWACYATQRRGNTIEIFRNGISIQTGDATGKIHDISEIETIGITNSSDAEDCNIASVSLYNRALTPNEIQLLYEQPHALTMRRSRQWVVPTAASGAPTSYYYNHLLAGAS